MPNHELTKRFGVNLRERMRDVGSERLPHEMFELLAKLSQGEPQPLKVSMLAGTSALSGSLTERKLPKHAPSSMARE